MTLRTGARLYGAERLTPAAEVWGEARLPFDTTGYERVCGGVEGGSDLSLAEVFANEPIAVWIKRQ